ncbi:MAG: hypothetical protein FOGNACKC_02751 [Anaerolineae bacterium]|nr:hypothetical protein [Anaerolineae bacterium]
MPEKTASRQSAGQIALYILIAVLIVIILLLPPISLVDRLSNSGFQPIGAAGGAVQAADGAALQIPPGAVGGTSWLNFYSDNNPPAVPPYLTAAGPVYRIDQRGQQPQSVRVMLPLPTGAAAPELYVLQNGGGWRWLPAQLEGGALTATLNPLPEAVTLLQSAATPGVALNDPGDATLPAGVNQLTPGGVWVQADGSLDGEPAESGADVPVRPVISNRRGDEVTPLDKLLGDAGVRQAHILALAKFAAAYNGIELDYELPDAAPEAVFVEFLTELRAALPADSQLAVRLAAPQKTSTGWDVGPFDVAAIGPLVDVLVVPGLPPTASYAADGDMAGLLAWLSARVERHKLQLLVRTTNSEWVGGRVRDLSDEELLTRLGEMALLNAPAEIQPGQKLEFTLIEPPASTGLRLDEASGAYWLAFVDDENRHHTIYLANTALVAPALALAQQFRLGGVTVQTDPANSQPALVALDTALAEQAVAAADREYSVVWRVQSEQSTLLAEATVDLRQPQFVWTAPEQGGQFEVAAAIAANQSGQPLPRGTLVVLVSTPTPTPTNTPTPTRTPRPTRTPSPTPSPTPTPRPAAPASQPPPQQPAAPPPPAVKPVNVPFGYGIQADPRGNTGGNIAAIQRLGFNWIKFQMAWKDVESKPNDFSWGMWDEIINAYSANGIRVLLSIPKAPDWARPFDDDKSVEGPPADPDQYARFVALVAERYRGRVQAIEVWNEQNLWYEAGGAGRIDPAKYVDLLQRSYRAIKAANPDMIVVSGALTPAGNVGDLAKDDVEYLQGMYAAGAKGYFDALGAHPSGYNCPALGDWRTVADAQANFRGPFENRHHSWCFRGTMEGYREVMVANGDGDKAIVPTEFGWAVSGNPQPGYEYARDNTPEEQAQWIVEAYQLAKQWGWVGPMFLWNLDYGETAKGTELANFSILNTPAFEALAGMAK